jgi:hypothetical protein
MALDTIFLGTEVGELIVMYSFHTLAAEAVLACPTHTLSVKDPKLTTTSRAVLAFVVSQNPRLGRTVGFRHIY